MDDDLTRPVLSGADDASDGSRLDGLIAQIRHDAPGMSSAQLEKLVSTRLSETGITMTDEDRARLIDELGGTETGDAPPM